MSSAITLDDAQANLRKVIGRLNKGDEVAIMEGSQIVARIVGERASPRPRPGPGLCKGMITIVADDDQHLKAFAE